MPRIRTLAIAAAGLATVTAMPAIAQDVDADAADGPVVQWGRMNAAPGTFWLDSLDDVELIRYTSPRDVSLCLPEPTGVFAAQKGIPLQITWDNQYTVTLRPGNCFYFDAKTVKVKPAAPLPTGVTLTGRVQTASALRRGDE